ncbi:hypothetical protein KIPB_000794, partial [Kipferlia bialata]
QESLLLRLVSSSGVGGFHLTMTGTSSKDPTKVALRLRKVIKAVSDACQGAEGTPKEPEAQAEAEVLRSQMQPVGIMASRGIVPPAPGIDTHIVHPPVSSPFGVGAGDVSPFGPSGPGSGSVVGPHHPGGFPVMPQTRSPGSTLPDPFSRGLPNGVLPRGAVPPGARFDPFGPPPPRDQGEYKHPDLDKL